MFKCLLVTYGKENVYSTHINVILFLCLYWLEFVPNSIKSRFITFTHFSKRSGRPEINFFNLSIVYSFQSLLL